MRNEWLLAPRMREAAKTPGDKRLIVWEDGTAIELTTKVRRRRRRPRKDGVVRIGRFEVIVSLKKVVN